MYRFNQRFRVALLALLATGAVCLGDAEKNEALAKAAQWERAALNREWAAFAQLEQAGEAQSAAESLRSAPREDAQDARTKLQRAGGSELAACGSYVNAMTNFDKAADNWKKAARQYKQAGSEQNQRAAEEHAREDVQQGTSACRLAALAAERAAEDFGAEGAGMLNRAAAASQTAATWWERLAGRD